MKLRKPIPTDQELQIMKVVWRRGSATVRDVFEELLTKRDIAYTTVMTMMNILEQKGRLRRTAAGQAYVYTPAEPQGKVEGSIVQDFLKRVFDGSAKPLLAHLVESRDISQEHLDEIRALLKEKREKQ